MSKNYIEIIAIVEGKTEQIFIDYLLKPYLAEKNIFITATLASKSGQSGGDVHFERVKNDINLHLKHRNYTYVTTLIDYYGTKEWPGFEQIRQGATPKQISDIINSETKKQIVKLFSENEAERRFIPYMAIHEFEALLFSDSSILSSELRIDQKEVDKVLEKCGEAEAVNNSPETAPSKRLNKWSSNGKFKKTTTGILIAGKIGIEKMREKCPLFNNWLINFETIQKTNSHE